ncbi:hypothetical protein ACEQPO_05880 [Bacillus sp. SL00103]
MVKVIFTKTHLEHINQSFANQDSGGELTGILGIDLDASVVPQTTQRS